MERVKGIEPSSQAWEARILPLNHTRFRLGYFVTDSPPRARGIYRLILPAFFMRLDANFMLAASQKSLSNAAGQTSADVRGMKSKEPEGDAITPPRLTCSRSRVREPHQPGLHPGSMSTWCGSHAALPFLFHLASGAGILTQCSLAAYSSIGFGGPCSPFA